MLSFSLGKAQTRWGLSITQVAEVRQSEPLLPVACSPGYLMGLLWWRDEPVPVVDLNLRQGWPGLDFAERILVARIKENSGYLGFHCGSDVKIERDLETYQPIPLSESIHGSLATGAFQRDNRETLIIPDLATVLA